MKSFSCCRFGEKQRSGAAHLPVVLFPRWPPRPTTGVKGKKGEKQDEKMADGGLVINSILCCRWHFSCCCWEMSRVTRIISAASNAPLNGRETSPFFGRQRVVCAQAIVTLIGFRRLPDPIPYPLPSSQNCSGSAPVSTENGTARHGTSRSGRGQRERRNDANAETSRVVL